MDKRIYTSTIAQELQQALNNVGNDGALHYKWNNKYSYADVYVHGKTKQALLLHLVCRPQCGDLLINEGIVGGREIGYEERNELNYSNFFVHWNNEKLFDFACDTKEMYGDDVVRTKENARRILVETTI